jgi:methylated-DNA-[protein]-cysteine S-methyltransferase
MLYQAALDTPVGRLLIEGTQYAVTAIRFVPPDTAAGQSCRLINHARKQLREYFRGERTVFDVPLSLDSRSPFQRAVLEQVSAIDYGQTSTYAEIARRIKRVTSPRAVGQANARNPISIIIPCHRVLGTNGKLTGYGGGIAAKEWLLKHEKAILA